ncbi:hypothetical protein CDCA_CDCA20G4770 [Cyanidium caldarium]|uniref:thioredoxin-dependent peroxiredoxin n=1 Tax=Cyanidium caldarium TaxID=2771 RepID=A0AAV9J2F0_CYACA|nr:hypothetical protein CDCA_CDCA20G4770 [Cyanidium caldarium]
MSTRSKRQPVAAAAAVAVRSGSDTKTDKSAKKDRAVDYRDIEVLNDTSEAVTLRQLCADGPVVVFLVPKANTPGCNRQYGSFTERYQEFTKLGVRCFVLSKDKPEALARWRAKYKSEVRGLSDPQQTLIAALKARKPPANTIRSHFVFSAGDANRVADAIPVSPDRSCELALQSVKEHLGKV